MANSLGKLVTVGAAVYGAFKLFNRFTPGQIADTRVTFNGQDTTDHRVKLIVPGIYLQGNYTKLSRSKGIIFPYTPQITIDSSADYAQQNLMHSNYTIYSYKNSKVGAIQMSAKFTVQNDEDADYYITVLNLLRALTKMRTRSPTGPDPFAGAPPPVCRLQAYGQNMLYNVPVVISSFRTELPAEVDYYSSVQSLDAVGEAEDSGITSLPVFRESNLVPTVSSITMTLLPMYSRNEMLDYNVDSWLKGRTNKERGYL